MLQIPESHECSICLKSECNISTDCGHCFHLNCLIYSYSKSKQCPDCLTSQLELIRLYCDNCHSYLGREAKLSMIEEYQIQVNRQSICENCSSYLWSIITSSNYTTHLLTNLNPSQISPASYKPKDVSFDGLHSHICFFAPRNREILLLPHNSNRIIQCIFFFYSSLRSPPLLLSLLIEDLLNLLISKVVALLAGQLVLVFFISFSELPWE